MKVANKITAFIAAGVLIFGMMCFVGCSSEEDPATPPEITTADIDAKAIEVTDVGFTLLEDGTVSYAFTVNNPNEGYIADGVTFTIEGFDADNVMLIGGGETIQQIYPGVVTAAAGTAYMPVTESGLVRFEVTPLMEHVTWTKTDKTPEEIADMFSVSNVSVEDTEAGVAITGSISENIIDEPSDTKAVSSPIGIQNARVVALLLDAEDNVICGAESPSIMFDTNTTTFVISFPGNVEYSTYRLIVTPSVY